MPALRVIAFALCLLARVSAAGETPGIPSLFSDVPPSWPGAPVILAAPPIVRAPLPLSPEVRRMLIERTVAAIARVQAGAPPMMLVKRAWTDERGDAIVMDRYVVNLWPEKKVEVEHRANNVARAVTTGLLYEPENGGPALYWGLADVRAPRYGTASSAPRFELSLRWRR